MKKIGLILIAVAFVGGCAKTVEESKPSPDESPATESAEEKGTVAAQPDAAKSTTDVVKEDGPIDAESLLAATLAQATAEDKRVMVHLGAPW